MTVTAVLDLGQRLERARSRRFVGRTAELELFAARLEAAAAGDTAWDLFSVLWVHGPGGIGKSTLLSAYAEAARKAGFTVLHIDGGRIRPTPAGIRASVPDSLGNRTRGHDRRGRAAGGGRGLAAGGVPAHAASWDPGRDRRSTGSG